MSRTSPATRQKAEKPESRNANPFKLRTGRGAAREAASDVHVLAPGIICDTEARGHATPQGRSRFEIVVDASEGFIPLWASNTTLRWRFRERSMDGFANPAAAKQEIRKLFAEALVAWDTAAPVRFTEDTDVWDFEIVMRSADNCDPNGCVLASSFFPDGGRHKFLVYPKMFTQSREEQVDTFIHEIGHIFGLRHFFANVSEKAWPSLIFGTHDKFSIMNYGNLSQLTEADKDDLERLYEAARNGTLTHINGTPIRLVKPFSALNAAPHAMVAVGQPQLAAFQAQTRIAYVDGM